MHLKKYEQQEKTMQSIHFSDPAEQILVTGATGFIGQQLVSSLLADGQHVTILTRNPKQAALQFDGKVRCISHMNQLAATEKIDVIINLAGARILGWRWSQSRQDFLRQSRIDLTNKLVAWIASAQHKPRVLLSASAIGYYGIQAQDDDSALTEESAPQAIFMSQLCQDWEAAAHQAQAYGVHIACMRFGLVLGHQGPLPMLLLPIKLGLGGALGGGKQVMSWIHVHDVLRGIAHLWHTKNDGAYNFTAPQTLTQKQFSQTAAQVLHRPCFFPTPGFPMRIMLGEQADLLLEGQRVVPSRLLAEGFQFTYPELKNALASLL